MERRFKISTSSSTTETTTNVADLLSDKNLIYKYLVSFFAPTMLNVI